MVISNDFTEKNASLSKAMRRFTGIIVRFQNYSASIMRINQYLSIMLVAFRSL